MEDSGNIVGIPWEYVRNTNRHIIYIYILQSYPPKVKHGHSMVPNMWFHPLLNHGFWGIFSSREREYWGDVCDDYGDKYHNRFL